MSSSTRFQPPLDPPHGFGDDARSRQVRARPSPSLLRWVERELAARVVGTRARRGGSTSAIHEVRLESPAGARTTAVLRSYVLDFVIEEEPDLVPREAKVLRMLEPIALPTPTLLATDPDGQASGVPSLVMSRLSGRVTWHPDPATFDAWLDGLADNLVTLHATTLPDDHGLGRFDPYEPRSWTPPPWMQDASRWERAVAAFHAPPVDDQQLLIHRDYHPGNVLWTRRSGVTGVVDWPVACLGPPSADAFWCFVNLLPRFGVDVAERFLTRWAQRAGRTYHPWAEIVLAVDVLDSRDDERTFERVVLEDRLARGLAELGL